MKELIDLLEGEIDKVQTPSSDEDSYESFANGHRLAMLSCLKVALQTELMVISEGDIYLSDSITRTGHGIDRISLMKNIIGPSSQ